MIEKDDFSVFFYSMGSRIILLATIKSYEENSFYWNDEQVGGGGM